VAEQPSEPNGSTRPSLPWILFAISTAVAVLATAGFVYVILKRTTGPVEVLHDFYQAAHNGDCEATHELLVDAGRPSLEEWCAPDGPFEDLDLPATFDVDRVSLEGDTAIVTVEHPDGTRLEHSLERAGQSWRIGLGTG
jgi:hypothetical protein